MLRNHASSFEQNDSMSALSAVALSERGRIGIIGAGVVGLCCAIHLQRQGFRVEVVDPRDPGEGASLGNAGIIAISEVFPVARAATLRRVPRMLFDPTGPLVVKYRYAPFIAPWLIRFVAASRPAEVRRITQALASLLAPAMEAWRDMVQACGVEHRLVSQGWLHLFTTRRHLAIAVRDAELQRELGVRADVLGTAEICDLEPALAPIFAGGIFFPGAGNLTSPLGMMRVLAAHVVQNGGIIEKREASHIEIADSQVAVVDVSGTRTTYDRVIIAAGAWSRRLIRTLGLDVPLDTERGYHIMLPTPSQPLRRPVTVPDPGYTLVQMEDGMRLTTGAEFAGLSAPPDFRRIWRMIKHAQTGLPGLSPHPIGEWLGFRPSMPKSMPVIGPVPRYPQVILAFGHGHLGLTLAPVTGQLVAATLAGRVPDIDLTPFLPMHSVR